MGNFDRSRRKVKPADAARISEPAPDSNHDRRSTGFHIERTVSLGVGPEVRRL